MKRLTARAIVTLQLLTLPLVCISAPPADTFVPGVHYYFSDFNPEQRPWEPGQSLNIEEVFKNYQYYEIVFVEGGDEIIVSQYVRGAKVGTEKYFRSPDGSLRK